MTVVARMLDINAPSGSMDCFVAHPDGAGLFPLVVMFMDVWGLREELFDLARRVAGEGYVCVLPNLFYRHGKLRFTYRTPDGKAMSFVDLPRDVQDHMRSFSRQVARESVREDIGAILAAAKSWPVSDGPAGSVGFCLGGRATFYAGQEFPDRFRANASLHGTLLYTDLPLSAHRKIGAMRGEMYCGYGELDDQSTPAIVEALGRLFKDNPNIAYRGVVHPGAKHGYSMPDRDVHDRAATDEDWREIFAMLRRQLG